MESETYVAPIIVCDRNIWHGTQAELNAASHIFEFKFWQPEGAALLNHIINTEKVALN